MDGSDLFDTLARKIEQEDVLNPPTRSVMEGNRTMLLFVPSRSRIRYLLGESPCPAKVHNFLFDNLNFGNGDLDPTLRADRLEAIKQVCRIVTDAAVWQADFIVVDEDDEGDEMGYLDTTFDSGTIALVLQYIERYDDKALFSEALPFYFLDEEYHPFLEVIVGRHGVEWLQGELSTRLSQVTDCASRFNILNILPENDNQLCSAWMATEYGHALSLAGDITHLSQEHLLQLTIAWGDHPQLNDILLPALLMHAEKIEGMTSFLWSIACDTREGFIPEKFVRAIAVMFSERRKVCFHDAPEVLGTSYEVIEIIEWCHKQSTLPSIIDQMFITAGKRVFDCKVTAMPQYLSFFADLSFELERRLPHVLSMPSYLAFGQNIVAAYIRKCVTPLRPTLVRKPGGCGCEECKPLDEFLRDGTRTAAVFETSRHVINQFANGPSSSDFSVDHMFCGSVIRMQKTFNVRVGAHGFKCGLERWERESPALKAQLLEVGEPLLKSVLGDELFHDAMELMPVPRAPVMESWQTSQPERAKKAPFNATAARRRNQRRWNKLKKR